MPVARLKDFLDKNDVKDVSITHSKAFTARTVAGAAHIPGREMAKTVVVDLDGQHVLVVVPAGPEGGPGAPAPGDGGLLDGPGRGTGLHPRLPRLRARHHAALRRPLRPGGL